MPSRTGQVLMSSMVLVVLSEVGMALKVRKLWCALAGVMESVMGGIVFGTITGVMGR